MKIGSYCYTRGEQPDYRDFCIPSNVGKNIVSILRNMVAPILESRLDTPRWVLYKCHDVVAWGICCKNELLSSSFNTDIKGRSVKGFFSIIYSEVDDRNFCIPSFDVSFFRELYKKEVAAYWDCQEGDSHFSKTHSINNDVTSYIYAEQNEYSTMLNTDVFQCLSLGNVDREKAVAAALSFTEMSLLIDNEEMSEATSRKAPFMNCLSSQVANKSAKVQRICPQCHKYVNAFTENGICIDCETENCRINMFNDENQNDMEQIELKNLERELRDCRFRIEETDKALAKERRMNKILVIVCGIFLLMIAYLWHNSKSGVSLFGNHDGILCDTIVKTIEKPYQFNVMTNTFEVPAKGKDSVVIVWKSDIPRVRTNIDNYKWIKGISEDATSITLRCEKNDVNTERIATIELILGEKRDTVTIKQAAK